MSRLPTDTPFHCVTCEAAIWGSPTFFAGLPFCCAGCVAGGPCTCSYDAEPTDRAEAVDVRTVEPRVPVELAR
jgi:hypothetical protein